jgi:uncharacterized membrane protein
MSTHSADTTAAILAYDPQMGNGTARIPLESPKVIFQQNRSQHLHPGVYILFLGAFVWLFIAAWIAFRTDNEGAFAVVVSIVYAAIYFGVPYICYKIAIKHGDHPEYGRFHAFLIGEMDINTGRILGWEATIQVCSIPYAIAFAMTYICFAKFFI